MESLERMVSSFWDQEQTSAEQVTGITLRETDHMSFLLPAEFTVIHSDGVEKSKQAGPRAPVVPTAHTHPTWPSVPSLQSILRKQGEKSGKYSTVSSSWIMLLVFFPQAIL